MLHANHVDHRIILAARLVVGREAYPQLAGIAVDVYCGLDQVRVIRCRPAPHDIRVADRCAVADLAAAACLLDILPVGTAEVFVALFHLRFRHIGKVDGEHTVAGRLEAHRSGGGPVVELAGHITCTRPFGHLHVQSDRTGSQRAGKSEHEQSFFKLHDKKF